MRLSLTRHPALRRCGLLLLAITFLHHTANALEVKVSAEALERTLKAQLFSGPDGRYYIRGDAHSACYVYADSPHVVFKDDRVIVHVHTRSKLGTGMRSTCFGVGLTTDADVSLVPQAEGESIGFRDARIDHLTDSRELNFFLVPFLSRKLPSEMKLNAADLVGKLLTQSVSSTGYAVKLDSLKVHSMLVDHQTLVVDVDADVTVR